MILKFTCIISFVKRSFSVTEVKCWKWKVKFPSGYLTAAMLEHSSLKYEINIKKKWCFSTVKFPLLDSERVMIFGTSSTVSSVLQVTPQAGTAWKLKAHCRFWLSRRAFRISILSSCNNWMQPNEHVSTGSNFHVFLVMFTPLYVCCFLFFRGVYLFWCFGWGVGVGVWLSPNPCYFFFFFQRKMGFWLLDDRWNGFPVRRTSSEIVAEGWRRNWEIPTC